jgi:DNA-binding HxlR family transcriptional regulator
VADEPSNGELGRQIGTLHTLLDARFSELNARLDKVVSLDVYTVQTTHVEQRLAQLGTDIQRCSDANAKLEDDFEAYQRVERDRREDERQKRLYQAVIPILVCLMSAVIAVWAVIAK